MEIFTTAPIALDNTGTKDVGELGVLRIVSVSGTRAMAEAQVLRYRDRGFFATVIRSDAVAFLTQNETFERPRGADIYEHWKRQGSIDGDKTMPPD